MSAPSMAAARKRATLGRRAPSRSTGKFQGPMPRRPPTRKPPAPPDFSADEREAVLAINRAFYRVASDRDLEAMDQLWAPTGVVFCLHPNQPPLLDRAAVMAGGPGILSHPRP